MRLPDAGQDAGGRMGIFWEGGSNGKNGGRGAFCDGGGKGGEVVGREKELLEIGGKRERKRERENAPAIGAEQRSLCSV